MPLLKLSQSQLKEFNMNNRKDRRAEKARQRNNPVKVLDSAWHSYSKQVIPISASVIQRQECRRAFYAGAQSFLNGMMTGLGSGKEPTNSDINLIESISDELKQFAEELTDDKQT